MCVSSSRTGLKHCRSLSRVLFSSLGFCLTALVTTGCEDDVRPAAKRPATRALDQTGVAIGQEEAVNRAPAQAPQQAKQSGPIIGQRTANIRKADTEVRKGDATVVKPRITAKDYISLQGNAYVSIIGQTSILTIQHAMDIYRATNDRYPKDYEEFTAEIIKANNITLPQLPPYQKYGYDDKEHKLVILEYPALKDQLPQQ
jgi:hypothetical protein